MCVLSLVELIYPWRSLSAPLPEQRYSFYARFDRKLTTATRYLFQSVTAPSARLEHPAVWVQENACLGDPRGRTTGFVRV